MSGDVSDVADSGRPVPSQRILDVLDTRELVVASNREPYEHRYDGDTVSVSKTAGGLTAAIDPILQEIDGTWFAWGSGDADFDTADESGRISVPPGDPEYTLRRVKLTEGEVDGYYNGYANQVLWPICHEMPTRLEYDEQFWRAYVTVNDRFAGAIASGVTGPDPAVWLHDYHLALAGRLIRQQVPDAFITHFWHIPWPNPGTFAGCPHNEEVLLGLLANDVVAFHRESYARNFLATVKGTFENCVIDEGNKTVKYGDHTTRVRSAPLGIDAKKHARIAETPEIQQLWTEFADTHDLGENVAVGVDRIDYTKGILERLAALARLWERRPDLRGALTFVQKGSISRSAIDDYRQLHQSVKRRVSELNETYGTETWTPVVYTTDHYSREKLSALYRNADIGLVSPLQDGMNLVAKEYIAAQTDDDGVLVLSEFAGAVDSLGRDALVVNPSDTDGFASAIEAAIAMPRRTRARRMRSLRRTIENQDTMAWAARQFDGIDEDGEGKRRPVGWKSTPDSVWSAVERIRALVESADGLLLMSDFDGTVSEIVEDPDAATIRPRARTALQSLAAHSATEVAIVSGRQVDDVRDRVGLDGLWYVGNHGLERYKDGRRSEAAVARRINGPLSAVCDALDDRFGQQEIFVENKGLTATVHYRRSGLGRDDVMPIVQRTVDELDPSSDLRITCGKQIIEIRPRSGPDKGSAVRRLRSEVVPDDETWGVLYIGDGNSDESAFDAIAPEGVTIRVGADLAPTAAQYSLTDPLEVEEFLAWIVDVARPSPGQRDPSTIQSQ